MRRFALLVGCTCLLVAWFAPAGARADATAVATLIQQLKNGGDEKVRAQAALALGATGDADAVQPLCDALRDRSPTVRTGVAAALGKLRNPNAVPCLQAAKAKETTPAVKGQIDRSLTLLATAPAAADAPPPPGPDTKAYAVLEIKNKTSRSETELEPLMRDALQRSLLEKKGFAVASRGETPAQAAKIIQAKRLKGFLLIVTVEPPVYAGGKVTQALRVSVWSYPDKRLLGEFAPKGSTDAPKPERDAEDTLMKALAADGVDTFVGRFARL